MENTQPFAAVPPAPQPLSAALISVGQLYRDTWALYKSRFAGLVAISVIPYGLIALGSLAQSAGEFAGFLLSVAGGLVLMPAMAGSILMVARGTDFRESYRQGFGLFFPMLWMGILSFAVVMGGMVLFIIPGLVMCVWFSVSTAALVLEEKRGLNALIQSREYVRDHWWEVLWRIIALSIPLAVVSGILANIFGQTAGSLASALTAPFAVAYGYLMYQSLAGIKPALAASQPASGRGLFIVSGILGVVAMTLLAGFLIFSLVSLMSKTGMGPIELRDAIRAQQIAGQEGRLIEVFPE